MERRFLSSSRVRASRKAFFCVMGSLSYVNFCSNSCSFFRCWRTCWRLSAAAVNLRDEEEEEDVAEEDASLKEILGGFSPVLQLVHAGVWRAADAGDLLPLLPLRQLLGDQVGQEGVDDGEEVAQLDHRVLEGGSG